MVKNVEKIGFFGGCFNPPNILHIKIAQELIKYEKLDTVVFVPVNDFYKKKDLIEAKHRLNMLKIATKEYKNIKVDDIEIKEEKKLYAIDAFKLMKKSKFLNSKNMNNIFYIMGSDNAEKMFKWKDCNIIKRDYNCIIINRDINAITSTKIREMIKNNNSDVKKYLNKEVYEYILKNNLYKL